MRWAEQVDDTERPNSKDICENVQRKKNLGLFSGISIIIGRFAMLLMVTHFLSMNKPISQV